MRRALAPVALGVLLLAAACGRDDPLVDPAAVGVPPRPIAVLAPLTVPAGSIITVVATVLGVIVPNSRSLVLASTIGLLISALMLALCVSEACALASDAVRAVKPPIARATRATRENFLSNIMINSF